ncbi:hypothetical protein [Domibacillus mangrovi]|uniref:hypothetical protein n=1 Tax=Domibacillus mangrovi TaxID=1714354 RepID=UPI000B04310E|nr:hypothetical protein [Domibacillus mangrovi]
MDEFHLNAGSSSIKGGHIIDGAGLKVESLDNRLVSVIKCILAGAMVQHWMNGIIRISNKKCMARKIAKRCTYR